MFSENLAGSHGILFAWFGGWEIAIIAGVFVLLFGSAKLPQLFRNMGRSVNEFKAGMNQPPEKLDDNTIDAEKETADV